MDTLLEMNQLLEKKIEALVRKFQKIRVFNVTCNVTSFFLSRVFIRISLFFFLMIMASLVTGHWDELVANFWSFAGIEDRRDNFLLMMTGAFLFPLMMFSNIALSGSKQQEMALKRNGSLPRRRKKQIEEILPFMLLTFAVFFVPAALVSRLGFFFGGFILFLSFGVYLLYGAPISKRAK